MASLASVIAANGLPRGDEIVELAAKAKLELACACTLLQKESGGANIYGHDPVDTGGTYTKGGPVTRENYTAYRAWRKAGSGRLQGVGPGQLTWSGFQDVADSRGGCWDWRVNAEYSFEILRDLIASHGLQDGFRAYNGTGSAAARYGQDAVEKVNAWRGRLAGASAISTNVLTASASAVRKALPGMIHIQFDKYDGDRWGRIICPTGPKASQIVARAWLSISVVGGASFEAYFQRAADTDASPPGVANPVSWVLRNAQRDYVEIPNGCEYIDYKLSNPRGPGAILVEQQPA